MPTSPNPTASKTKLKLEILSISIQTHEEETTGDCELLRDVASLTEKYVSDQQSAVVMEVKTSGEGMNKCELLRDVASLTENYVSDQSSVMTDVKIKTSGKEGRNKWRDIFTVVCLWISYLLCSAAYSIIAPFFPDEAMDKGASPVITGIIISASPFCVVVLSPILGYFLPQLGLRFMVFGGLLLLGGGFVLLGFMSMVPSGWIFITLCIILRIAEGVGTALFITATFTLLPILYPRSVSTLSGLFEVAFGFGFAAGPPIGGLLYEVGGFMLPFISVGGTVLLITIPSTLMLSGTGFREKQTPMMSVIFKLCTTFSFMVLVSVNTLSIAAFGFFVPILQPFLIEEFNLNPVEIGLIFFTGSSIYMLSSFVVGPLSDRFGPRYFIILGLVGLGLVFFFFGPPEFIGSPKIWITRSSFACVGVAVALTIIPGYADMLAISMRGMEEGENLVTITAVVSGIASSALSFGAFIGPLIGGTLTQVFSLQTSSVFIGEIFMAEALLLLGVTVIDKYTGL